MRNFQSGVMRNDLSILLPPFPHRPPGVVCGIRNSLRRPVCGGSIQHWYKLKLAWHLLELYEKRLNAKYDVVIKFRADMISLPIELYNRETFCTSAHSKTLRSFTDMAFWGNRDVMKVAASFFDNFTLFANTKWKQRPLHARAMLKSLHDLPPRGRTKVSWKFTNKLITLPFPCYSDCNNVTVSNMLLNLERAVRDGWDFIDPAINNPMQPLITSGDDNKKKDRVDYCMCSCEKDFLVWMIANNITMGEFFKNYTSVVWKGHVFKAV